MFLSVFSIRLMLALEKSQIVFTQLLFFWRHCGVEYHFFLKCLVEFATKLPGPNAFLFWRLLIIDLISIRDISLLSVISLYLSRNQFIYQVCGLRIVHNIPLLSFDVLELVVMTSSFLMLVIFVLSFSWISS